MNEAPKPATQRLRAGDIIEYRGDTYLVMGKEKHEYVVRRDRDSMVFWMSETLAKQALISQRLIEPKQGE